MQLMPSSSTRSISRPHPRMAKPERPRSEQVKWTRSQSSRTLMVTGWGKGPGAGGRGGGPGPGLRAPSWGGVGGSAPATETHRHPPAAPTGSAGSRRRARGRAPPAWRAGRRWRLRMRREVGGGTLGWGRREEMGTWDGSDGGAVEVFMRPDSCRDTDWGGVRTDSGRKKNKKNKNLILQIFLFGAGLGGFCG